MIKLTVGENLTTEGDMWFSWYKNGPSLRLFPCIFRLLTQGEHFLRFKTIWRVFFFVEINHSCPQKINGRLEIITRYASPVTVKNEFSDM